MRLRMPTVTEHEQLTPVVEVRAERASKPPSAYAESYQRVQEALRGGYSYEVNLTYREHVESELDPEAVYLRLRADNPAPYAGFLQHGDVALLSSSPERYATIDRRRWLETKPIKGTTPRGATPEEDDVRRHQLATDARYRAENLMIVDLLRNDLSMVCAPGTVTVPALMEVESYATVHQLVSTVRGHLRDEVSTIGALRALFPAGSMTGAPKLQTMRIIDEVEATPRGVYAGAFGWVSADGRADLGVVIRSLVASRSAGVWRYEYGTGGGITVHSDAESEYAETRWKADRLRKAVTG
jgi:anthranilate/para-aminobenzoate synthase component I